MAELQNYQQPQALDQAAEASSSESHESNRAQRQHDVSQAEVERANPDGLSEFFNEARPGNINLLFTGDQVEDLANATRERVFSILDNSANAYVGTLNQSSAAHLEGLAWQHRQHAVLDRIEDINTSTQTSLTVIEGYEKFLANAKTKANSEWNEQKSRNTELSEQFGRWSRFLGRDRALKQFEEGFDTQLAEVFTSLDNNVKALKESSQKRVTAMQKRIESRWNSSQHDPQLRQNLWQEITTVAQANNLAVAGNLPLFGVDTGQDRVDFAEACLKLEWVVNGLDGITKSEQKHQNRTETLTGAQNIDVDFRTGHNFDNFISLGQEPIFTDIEPLENDVTPETLLTSFTNDLENANVDVNTLYSQNLRDSEMLTNTHRLIILIDLISASTQYQAMLGRESRQQFVTWMHFREEEYTNGVEAYNNQNVTNRLEDITGPSGIAYELDACLSAAQGLTVASNLTAFTNAVTAMSQKCVTGKALFDQEKVDFPDTDRQAIEALWTKVNNYRQELENKAHEWQQIKINHSTWSSRTAGLTTAEQNALNALNAHVAPAPGTPDPVYAQLLQDHQRALGNLTQHQNNEPQLTPLQMNVLGVQAEMQSWQNTPPFVITPNRTPNLPPRRDFLRDKLLVPFKQELETKVLQKLEESDQYQELSRCAVGTEVEIEYKSLSGVNNIKVPRELQNFTSARFRVVRQIDGQGLRLESLNGNTVITILGPSVQNGQPYRNAVIAQNGPNNVQQHRQQGMAFNFRIQ